MFNLHLKALHLSGPPREQVGPTENMLLSSQVPTREVTLLRSLLFLWESVTSFSHNRKSILEIHQSRNPNSPQDSFRPTEGGTSSLKTKQWSKGKIKPLEKQLTFAKAPIPNSILVSFLSEPTPWARRSSRRHLRVCVSMSGGFWGIPAPTGGLGLCPPRFETEGWDFIDRIYAYWIT